MRIGHGYDAHRTEIGRKMVIGGVTIPCDFGLAAHSDGDVLTHAVIDALYGAAGLRDIGFHFPDNDQKFKNVDSLKLLAVCREEIASLGFVIDYIDCTILAQAPKMNPFLPDMKLKIAETLKVDVSRVNIKATTEEHMGFTGSGEGIAAHCVCLLKE